MAKPVRAGALALALALVAVTAPAQQLTSVGLSLGSLNNPFFISLSKGAQAQAKAINPAVKFLSVSAEWDVNRQAAQVDSFIRAGVDMMLINVVDPEGLAPAILRAKQAGIVVVAVDVQAPGADATVLTDNLQAGQIACQYLVNRLGGIGQVVIQSGPRTSAVLERIQGCKSVFRKAPGLTLLTDEPSGTGSREDGMRVMQEHLRRYAKLDAVFAFNDQQAIGADLAARQLQRQGILIAGVDGSPDIEAWLKGPTQVQASSSQDPYGMAVKAVQIGADLVRGRKPLSTTVRLPSTLVTRDNVRHYQGWEAAR